MKIKINTYIEFDEHKEKDLINAVNYLINSRQLSSFSSNAIKVVLNDPKLYEGVKVGKCQPLCERKVFFNNLIEKVTSIEKTLLALEDEIQQLNEFVRLKKALGFKDKLENLQSAQFLVKRQIQRLNQELGRIGTDLVTDKRNVIADITEMNQRADRLVEYIINYYDGICSELRVLGETGLVSAPVATSNKSAISIPKETGFTGNTEAAASVETNIAPVIKTTNNEEQKKDDEKVVDIAGQASAWDDAEDDDLDALLNF